MVFEIKHGCCGCTVRNTVCTGLVFSLIHGIFVVCFVFSTFSYPPFYYVDYMFGACGVGLIVFSFVTIWTVDLKSLQIFRSLFGFLMVFTIFATVVTNYFYAIQRWDDVVVTAFGTRRDDFLKHLPDELWMACVVLSCIAATILILYIPYICSFMFRPWKSHLFTTNYRNNLELSSVTLPFPNQGYK